MAPTHKVGYRLAQFEGERASPTIEDLLRSVLSGADHGSSYTARIFKVSDKSTKAVINRSELGRPGVIAEVFQLDPRRELPFLQHADEPRPVASVRSRGVPDNEDHMGTPAYFFAVGNHVAVIESIGLRTPQLQSYLNALFQSAGQLAPNENWKLSPKIEVAEGTAAALDGGISRLDIIPIARMIGDAPSEVDRRPTARTSARASHREEKVARGSKVFDLLQILGASDAEIGDMRSRMSADLGLEARVVISVRKDARGTTAKLRAADLSQAIASLEESNAVTLVSPEGTFKGRLVSLSRNFEIDHDGGLLRLDQVANALTAAMRDWVAQGIIDLAQG